MNRSTRSGPPAGPDSHERKRAFQKYDPAVSGILDDLKSALFPDTYYVHKVETGKWYVSPPRQAMRIHPVEVELCFDLHDRPVGFQITNYTSWMPAQNCELSVAALRQTLEKLFPAFANRSLDRRSPQKPDDWMPGQVG